MMRPIAAACNGRVRRDRWRGICMRSSRCDATVTLSAASTGARRGPRLRRARSESRLGRLPARLLRRPVHQLRDLAVRLVSRRGLSRHAREHRRQLRDGLRLGRQHLRDELLRPSVSRLDVLRRRARRRAELLGVAAVSVDQQLHLGICRRAALPTPTLPVSARSGHRLRCGAASARCRSAC